MARVFFPLAEQLELWEHHWSESVAKDAVWLSGLVTYAEADKFFTSHQVVDWYPAKLHLTQAAGVLHGEGTPAARRWLRDHETPLLQGHAEQLADQLRKLAQKHSLDATVLRHEAGYFQENDRHMQYLEVREEGFPIGSGMVESACKQFRARLTGQACAGHAPACSGCDRFARWS